MNERTNGRTNERAHGGREGVRKERTHGGREEGRMEGDTVYYKLCVCYSEFAESGNLQIP